MTNPYLSRTAALALGAVALLALLSSAANAGTRKGTAGSDRLTGSVGASTLDGRGGDDLLYGDPVAGMGKPRRLERISVGTKGQLGTQRSVSPAITVDGRTMMFVSSAPEFFGAGPSSTSRQVFSKNLATGAVTLVTLGSDGLPFSTDIGAVAVSPNGRFVAFTTDAANIPGVPLMPPAPLQLVLKDVATNVYTLVSHAPDGSPGSGISSEPVFSPDSTKLAFRSEAGNLDPGDANGNADIFLVALASPATVYRASTGAEGELAENGHSARPVFSPDSRSLAFQSHADTLVSVDNNTIEWDVFLKDLAAFDPVLQVVRGAVTLVSTNAGNQHTQTASSPQTPPATGRPTSR